MPAQAQDTPKPDPQQQTPPATPQPGIEQPAPAEPSTGAKPETTPATEPTPATGSTPEPGASTAPEAIVPETPPIVEPESTGPGILSRPFTTTALANQNVKFQPFLAVSGLYDSGLTTVSTTTSGQIVSNASYGVDAGFGISGRRVDKKDTLEIVFRGDAYRYTPNSSYDGGNYLLNLTYQHFFTRHILLALTENASLYSNNYSVINSATDLSVANAQAAVNPNTQLFDNRTIALSTGADVVIQKTARLSFDFGGTGFLVRRESTSLYGTVGYQARADATYRLTRRMTLGAYYAYSNYDFNKAFGGSDVETAGAIFSRTLARGLEFRLRGGASYVQTSGIETITIDPVIAAILGYNQGTIVIRRNNVVPDLSVQLAKTFRRGTASAEYVESVTPGNGLYLTSRHNGISAHYDYTGLRHWDFSAGFSRDTLSTLGILIGQYTSNDARIGFGRVLGKGLQATGSAEYRHYDVSEANFLHNSYRIMFGIAWTPSASPLRLW